MFSAIRSSKGASRCIPTLPPCGCLKIMKSLKLRNLGITYFQTNTHLPAFINEHLHFSAWHLRCETCFRASSASGQLHHLLKGTCRQNMPSSKPVEAVVTKLKDLADRTHNAIGIVVFLSTSNQHVTCFSMVPIWIYICTLIVIYAGLLQ